MSLKLIKKVAFINYIDYRLCTLNTELIFEIYDFLVLTKLSQRKKLL